MTLASDIEKATPTTEWYIVLRPVRSDVIYEVGEVVDTSGWRPTAVRALVDTRHIQPYPAGVAIPEPEVVDGRAKRRFTRDKVKQATPKKRARPKLTEQKSRQKVRGADGDVDLRRPDDDES